MWRQLEYTIEYESSALEEDIAPIPSVVFHDVVGLCLDPYIECNEDDATDPASDANGQHAFGRDISRENQ